MDVLKNEKNVEKSAVGRRDLMKLGAAAGAAVAGIAVVGSGTAMAAKTCSKDLIKESHPRAKGIKYKAKASAVEKGLWTKKAGVEPAKQECKYCSFYQKAQSSCPEKSAPCTMLAGVKEHVAAEAGCMVWAKAPGAKI